MSEATSPSRRWRYRTVKCCLCERRFAEDRAIPMRLRTNTFIGQYAVSWAHYQPACPRCVTWDAEAETGISKPKE